MPVTRAVLRGLRAADDPFERTPKRGGDQKRPYRALSIPFDTTAKLGMALVMMAYLASAIMGGYWGQLPFILLFLSGYLGLGLPALSERLGVASTTNGIEREQKQEGEPQDRAGPFRLRPIAGFLIGPEAEVADECEAA